jgi:hypothetical protein
MVSFKHNMAGALPSTQVLSCCPKYACKTCLYSAYEEATTKSFVTTTSPQFRSVEEEVPTIEKKRKKTKKTHKKKVDVAEKKRKIEEVKSKAKFDAVATTKAEAEAKAIVDKEAEQKPTIERSATIAEVARKATNEAIEKAVEEEQHKKYEEAQNDDTSPMDTNIPEISTVATSGHTQLRGLILGIHTPFKPSKVENLKKFKYDKAMGRIVQQQVKQVSFTRGNPLSLLT